MKNNFPGSHLSPLIMWSIISTKIIMVSITLFIILYHTYGSSSFAICINKIVKKINYIFADLFGDEIFQMM